ncbi:MAG: sulfite exporter TauE/SafE family protein [Rhodobacteraceae bacterium]|nr:sulfite exporter TauE/SafE family protein [Paracoccaceae bacterium]
MAELLPMLGFLLLIGAFSGVISGLLGVGGGIVLVPAFFHAFGSLGYGGPQLMQLCIGTSLATIVFTSIRSGLGHHRKGAVDWAMLRGWAPGLATGAVIGVLLAARLDSSVLQGVFGALGAVIGLYLAFGHPEWRLAPALPAQPLASAMAAALSFLSVLMGIGGGTFGVPLMTLHGVAIHRAVGTASVFGVIIATPSVIGFLLLPVAAAARPPYSVGAVNLLAFAAILAVSLGTTGWGVRLAHATDARRLRRIFGLFLLIVAGNMLRKATLG